MAIKPEGLTSFAENPTKTAERDALVDAQFTAPEDVEKAHVEPKWAWWCMKKYDKKWIPRSVIMLLICLGILLLILFGSIVFAFLLPSRPAETPEQPKVYTFPTDHPSQDSSTAHGRMLFPTDGRSKFAPSIPEVNEEEYAYHEDVMVSPKEVSTTSATTLAPTETPTETTSETSTTKVTYPTPQPIIYTTQPPRPSPSTRRISTSTSYLEFHDSLDGEQSETCLERLALGSPSGVYPVVVANKKFEVFCDMDTTGGGWTVIQKRSNNLGSFHRRTLKEYMNGFGDLKGNHWLGLDKINLLAPLTHSPAVLRLEIEGETCNSKCTQRFANSWYGEWPVQIGSKADGYKIVIGPTIAGNLSVNGVDPFETGANGNRFVTVDNTNGFNCAQFRMLGPWWHSSQKCSDVALNGYYMSLSEKYDVADPNQNAKRYFVYAFDRETLNGFPYTIHVHKSTMLLKSMILEK